MYIAPPVSALLLVNFTNAIPLNNAPQSSLQYRAPPPVVAVLLLNVTVELALHVKYELLTNVIEPPCSASLSLKRVQRNL